MVSGEREALVQLVPHQTPHCIVAPADRASVVGVGGRVALPLRNRAFAPLIQRARRCWGRDGPSQAARYSLALLAAEVVDT